MSRGAVRTRLWRNGIPEADDFPFEQISDFLEQPDCVVWADLCSPDDDQLKELAGELGLDQHAVEDATSQHARPKAIRYSTHIFLSTYAMRIDESGDVALTHVSAFCLPNALITVRLDDGFDIDEVVQRWDANADLLKYGKRALEYGLLDTIVDEYFETLQALDDQIEALQDVLFDDSQADGRPLQRRTFELRSALLRARRVLLPMRDLVETVMRRATDNDVAADLMSYFQDLNDHILRAAEWSESLREMVASIFETNISLADARLNIVVRRLTSWAAIVAVPTALTGFFGQNLGFPGYGTRIGFAVSLSLIVVVCVGLWAVFRRKGWL
jgi:magnesium transporter